MIHITFNNAPHTCLSNFLKSFSPFSEKEMKQISESFHLEKVSKRQRLLQAGKVCKEYSFVVQVYFRMYGIDDRGFEHNIQFAPNYLPSIAVIDNYQLLYWKTKSIEYRSF